MSVRKPMKGDDYVEGALEFPCLVSPKVDGFRAYNDGGLCTSSGKPFMNEATREFFSSDLFEGLDGEMIVGRPDDPKAFAASSGPLRRAAGDPKATWLVFDDRTNPSDSYIDRLNRASYRIAAIHAARPDTKVRIELWDHKLVRSLHEFDEFEQVCLEKGFEGMMKRSLNGPYKFGRSTVKEGYLLKVKRHKTEEATIFGFEELMHNDNPEFKDELGRTKRSEDAAGLRPSGMVGSFWVKSPDWILPFKISAGSMSHEAKREAFVNFSSMYNGKLARYSYFPYGVKDVPRHGIFDGIRPVEDL
jgi:DNA ligase 1